MMDKSIEVMTEELAYWLKYNPRAVEALHAAVQSKDSGGFMLFIPKSPMVRLHACGWALPAHEAEHADATARFCPRCGVRRQAES